MLELIKNLSKSLDKAYNAQSIAGTLRDFFNLNFNVKNLEIFIFDEKSGRIKDFSQEWLEAESGFDSNNNENVEIFDKISKDNFFIENGILFYSLPKQGRSIGFLKFSDGDFEKITEFLKTAVYLISLKIQNILLAENMQKNIDFHELIRNIAKIIETQYELSYIIPLIGEMIDKFMTNHLVYIFVKNNGKFELLWPSNCNDTNILNAFETLPEKNE